MRGAEEGERKRKRIKREEGRKRDDGVTYHFPSIK
jgi:hypothetical protein